MGDMSNRRLITPANAGAIQALARRCDYCGRMALRGKPWCSQHGPGRAKQRNPKLGRTATPEVLHLLRVRWGEVAAERLLPTAMLAWPPIERLLVMRPRASRPVRLAALVSALVWASMGRWEAWSDCVSDLRHHGIMKDSDPDIITTCEGRPFETWQP